MAVSFRRRKAKIVLRKGGVTRTTFTTLRCRLALANHLQFKVRGSDRTQKARLTTRAL